MRALVKRWLDWRRLLVYTHRWMGIAGGLLFVAWFASGIVMMYARMPELTPDEALARARTIDLTAATIGPADAAALERSPDGVRIAMLRGRPVYRLQRGRTTTTVFADSGERFRGLSENEAVALVRDLVPEDASTIRYDVRLADADQWTLGVRAQAPLHRISLGDAADSTIYVSDRSGEPVMKTTRASRRWGYLGAVIHWLYFTPLRRQAAVWTQTIIWLSIAGCAMCLLGLIWGVWRYSPGSRFRLKHVHAHSPYVGFMRWHHYAGLIFGLFALTWVFSGLLSMGPFYGPGTAPTREQRDAVSGGPVPLTALSLPQLRAAVAVLGHALDAKEIDIIQFQGEPYAAAVGLPHGWDTATHDPRDPLSPRQGLVVSLLTPERGAFVEFPRDAVLSAARAAMPGVPVTDAIWLEEYDSYYYDRDGARPLPVLRVRYADPQGTWLYLDPRRGAIVRKEERRSRIERWLYHGLHSLDFPFLYYRRPLWDLVVITLSAGGIALSVTTLVPAWRRLRRHARHRFRLR